MARADRARGQSASDDAGAEAGEGETATCRQKAWSSGRASPHKTLAHGGNTQPVSAPLIVAIDGPSGVGKSTTSKLVARELRIPHIDTGAMYRAIGLKAKRRGIDTHDAAALEPLAEETQIDFVPGDPPHVLLDGEDVTALLRTPDISMAASDVSSIPGVRRVLVQLQQRLGRRSGGVLEGRDIGTVVFPDTPHKFFLTASARVRAERRYRELLAKGTSASIDDVLAGMAERDKQDSTRADSPLKYDESYTIIDTSALTIPDVVAAIVSHVLERQKAEGRGQK